MNRALTSITIYLFSVIANYVVIEILREGYFGDVAAARFIEFVAISILLSVTFELGIPSRIQWVLLSNRTQGGHQQITSDNTQVSSPSLKQRLDALIRIAEWCDVLARRDFNKQSLILSASVGTLLISVSIFTINSEDIGVNLLIVALISLLSTLRKIGCAFLEGAGQFFSSRLFQFLPIILLSIHLGLSLWLPIGLDSSTSAVLVYFLIYNVLATAFLFFQLSICYVSKHLPEIDIVISKSPTSSAKWHVLALAGALQQQVFFLIAPYFNLSSYTIFFYYGQKASQVLGETLNQVVKERVTEGCWRLSTTSYRNLLTKIVLLALVPAGVAFLAMMVAKELIGMIFVAAVLFFINEYISNATTLLGHVALYNGSTAPVITHLLNSIFQIGLVITITGLLGVIGYPIALLITGLMFSYRANYGLYSRYRIVSIPLSNVG